MRSAPWFAIGFYLMLGLSLSAMAQESGEVSAVSTSTAELKIANRSIVTLRSTLLGESPTYRVRRAEIIINEVLDGSEEVKTGIAPIQDSYMVMLGERRAFVITPKDLGPDEPDVKLAAEHAAQKLQLVIAETSEARNIRFLITSVGLSLLATLLYWAIVRGVFLVRRKLRISLPGLARQHVQALKIGETPVMETRNLYPLLGRLLTLLCWIVVFLASYEWLSFVLQRFPYTRPWGETLNHSLLELATYLLTAVVNAIPGLIVAVAIFFIARGAVGFVRRLLQRLVRPGAISWLTPETLPPTTRLASLAIWLFALAMAYPYLPGAETDAFKGLSVLIGLMISLGASSVVGQAAAGLILTYTHRLRPGEYVRIEDHEGTVTEVGMFNTTILTGLGEVLTIPNSMITGSVTRNYSRTVQGRGYVVDTTVTIGYDTPWRQVEALLLEAARRTPGVLETPKPQVFQTALSDFYPEYRLVAQAIPEEPRPRAELLTLLHANIQDVFNEYGVQIMSPHYLGDPEQEKVVPKEKWFSAPAQQGNE